LLRLNKQVLDTRKREMLFCLLRKGNESYLEDLKSNFPFLMLFSFKITAGVWPKSKLFLHLGG
ncbi:MAG: hypothetical protein AAF551_06430, partial [Bacteroidota bacterium]